MPNIEGSYSWIRHEAESQLSAGAPYGVYVWVKDVFPDMLIAEFERETSDWTTDTYSVETKLMSFPYTLSGSTLTLSEGSEVKLDYVTKRRVEVAKKERAGRGAELTGPIISIKEDSEDRRLVTGAVLVPGEADGNGEAPLSAERIEVAAHEWMQDWRYSDRDHDFGPAVAVPVESYILTDDVAVKMGGEDVVLPGGSWVVTSLVTDDTAWKDIKSGELTGYSIAGIKREALDLATKSESGVSEVALKATLLSDLGEDWISGAVSLVGQPAVPKGKWFAIKAHTEQVRQEAENREESREVEDRPGFFARMFGTKSEQREQAIESEGEDVAQLTDETRREIEQIVSTKSADAVVAALKEHGVIKEEESAEDKILTAVKALGDRLDKIESGESPVAAKEAEGTESGEGEAGETSSETSSEPQMVSVPADEWEKVKATADSIAQKQAARKNGAGLSALKSSDSEAKTEKSSDSDGPEGTQRDALGKKIKK